MKPCADCGRPFAANKVEWHASHGALCGRELKWPSNAVFSDCYRRAYERVLAAAPPPCRCAAIAAAVADVKRGTSLRAAARAHGIPRSTLQDRIKRGAP